MLVEWSCYNSSGVLVIWQNFTGVRFFKSKDCETKRVSQVLIDCSSVTDS